MNTFPVLGSRIGLTLSYSQRPRLKLQPERSSVACNQLVDRQNRQWFLYGVRRTEAIAKSIQLRSRWTTTRCISAAHIRLVCWPIRGHLVNNPLDRGCFCMSCAPYSGPDGASCHQCKSRRRLTDLYFCYNMMPNKTRKCRKKFCKLCLGKFYDNAEPNKGEELLWQCPSCLLKCTCAYCQRIMDPNIAKKRRGVAYGRNHDVDVSTGTPMLSSSCRSDDLGSDCEHRNSTKKPTNIVYGSQDYVLWLARQRIRAK